MHRSCVYFWLCMGKAVKCALVVLNYAQIMCFFQVVEILCARVVCDHTRTDDVVFKYLGTFIPFFILQKQNKTKKY